MYLCVRQLIWFVFEKAAVARKIFGFTMNDWERPFLWENPQILIFARGGK